MTANQIAYQQTLESARTNRVREQETERSNRANEANKLKELDESVRHNQATESETNRSNLAKEFESNRHNVASEQNQRYGNELSYAGTIARASAQRDVGFANLAESSRHNVASEQQAKYATDVQSTTQRLNTALTTATNRQVENIRQAGQDRRAKAELEVQQNLKSAEIGANVGSKLIDTFTKLAVPFLAH